MGFWANGFRACEVALRAQGLVALRARTSLGLRWNRRLFPASADRIFRYARSITYETFITQDATWGYASRELLQPRTHRISLANRRYLSPPCEFRARRSHQIRGCGHFLGPATPPAQMSTSQTHENQVEVQDAEKRVAHLSADKPRTLSQKAANWRSFISSARSPAARSAPSATWVQ